MNKFKKLTIIILGKIMLIAVISHFCPTNGHCQGSTTAKDVNVINTPSVTVTNPIGLATGTTVGIDPANNTVKFDATSPVTVRGEETEIVHNQLFPANSNPPFITPPVDVRAYKQIRIVIAKEVPRSNGSSDVLITPYIRYGDELNKKIQLDGDFLNNMNKVYEVPGQAVGFMLRGSSPDPIDVDKMRITIYGRRN